MAVRITIQVLAVVGWLASFALFLLSPSIDVGPLEFSLFIPLALVASFASLPFLLAAKLVETHRPSQALLVAGAVPVSIGIAAAVHTRPASPNGSDGLQVFAVMSYQLLVVAAMAAVGHLVDALRSRRGAN